MAGGDEDAGLDGSTARSWEVEVEFELDGLGAAMLPEERVKPSDAAEGLYEGSLLPSLFCTFVFSTLVPLSGQSDESIVGWAEALDRIHARLGGCLSFIVWLLIVLLPCSYAVCFGCCSQSADELILRSWTSIACFA